MHLKLQCRVCKAGPSFLDWVFSVPLLIKLVSEIQKKVKIEFIKGFQANFRQQWKIMQCTTSRLGIFISVFNFVEFHEVICGLKIDPIFGSKIPRYFCQGAVIKSRNDRTWNLVPFSLIDLIKCHYYNSAKRHTK